MINTTLTNHDCSQGAAQVEDVFGEEVEEKFQEQTRGQTQTGQLDITETLSRGDSRQHTPAAAGRTNTCAAAQMWS